jgi:predicted Zn-ribbon and HTH transcriptional regulator
MELPFETLKADLEAIGDRAINALKQIDHSQDYRWTRWKCKEWQYIKHFTKPVSLDSAGRCPRCKSTEFKPVL